MVERILSWGGGRSLQAIGIGAKLWGFWIYNYVKLSFYVSFA